MTLAEDFTVWNVTKKGVRTRMMVAEEHTWAPPVTRPAAPPKPEDRKPWEAKLGVPLEFSEFTESGYWDVDDVLRPIYEEASEVVGRKFEYPGGSEDE